MRQNNFRRQKGKAERERNIINFRLLVYTKRCKTQVYASTVTTHYSAYLYHTTKQLLYHESLVRTIACSEPKKLVLLNKFKRSLELMLQGSNQSILAIHNKSTCKQGVDALVSGKNNTAKSTYEHIINILYSSATLKG